VLEEKTRQHDLAIAVLQDEFPQLSADFVCLSGEITTLGPATVGIPALSAEISVLKTQTAKRLVNSIVQQLLMKVRKLQRESSTLNIQIAAMPLTDPASLPSPPFLSPAFFVSGGSPALCIEAIGSICSITRLADHYWKRVPLNNSGRHVKHTVFQRPLFLQLFQLNPKFFHTPHVDSRSRNIFFLRYRFNSFKTAETILLPIANKNK
jgi:hypothetical protein